MHNTAHKINTSYIGCCNKKLSRYIHHPKWAKRQLSWNKAEVYRSKWLFIYLYSPASLWVRKSCWIVLSVELDSALLEDNSSLHVRMCVNIRYIWKKVQGNAVHYAHIKYNLMSYIHVVLMIRAQYLTLCNLPLLLYCPDLSKNFIGCDIKDCNFYPR